jgi:hypothetical protein
MKQLFLGAMLFGSMACQSTAAAIRTFDFTASVSFVRLASIHSEPSSVPGIVSGTTVSVGDIVQGRFSFDDRGWDFNGATSMSDWHDATGFSLNFLSSGTQVDIAGAMWMHDPNNFGMSEFSLWNMGFGPVTAYLNVGSPRHVPFVFALGETTGGTISVAWGEPQRIASAFLGMRELAEVSPVPEPSTGALLLLGAGMAAAAVRRARRAP